MKIIYTISKQKKEKKKKQKLKSEKIETGRFLK